MSYANTGRVKKLDSVVRHAHRRDGIVECAIEHAPRPGSTLPRVVFGAGRTVDAAKRDAMRKIAQ